MINGAHNIVQRIQICVVSSELINVVQVILTQHIHGVSGLYVFRQLHVNTMANGNQRAFASLHRCCYVGGRYPSS